ncbi:MAG: type IV pilus secretin PilQ [Syntrophobacterales bacterium]|nr:type IV pilus secretin PilQ [Syntrophobacterales bacterium]
MGKYRKEFYILLSGLVIVFLFWSNVIAAILRLQGVDEKEAFVLKVETNSPVKDCKVLDRNNGSQIGILLEGVDMETSTASIPLQSSYLKRVVLKKSKTGILITGEPQYPWRGFTVNKDGNTVHIRIYPDRTSYNLSSRTLSSGPDKHVIPTMAKEQTIPSPELTMPFEGISEQTRVYTGKPISLDLVDADVKNVIRLIADITGMNIVVDPEVTGKITLKVEQVPWDQVLDMIFRVNNLGMEQSGNIIRVARKEKLRKEIEEHMSLIEAKKKLIEEQMSLERSKKNMGVLETHYLTVNYADMEVIKKQIENAIKSADGKLELDPRTRTLIYTDYRPRIEDAKRLISMLDKPLLQVLLEARVVTATSNFARSLGIDWGFNYQNIGSTDFDPANPGNRATSYNPRFAINNTPQTTSAPLSSLLGFGWDLLRGRDLFSIDMSLKLGERKGIAKLVSSPKVHTLNNQEAKISQGLEIPYTVQGKDQEPTTEFKEAKLELNVTPTVTPDKRVLLNLSVEKSDPDFSVMSAKGEPSIKKRTVTTRILVDDGSIVVLGGVLEESLSVSQSSTPGISKIPVLGNLFKSRDTKVEKNELLIFIRPKIIELPQIQLSAQ